MAALSGFREIILLLLLSLSISFINLCLQIHPIYAQTHVCTNTIGNYTQNSTFQSNLNTILSSVSSNINATDGFYNGKAGDGDDQVNVIGYCRGDVDIESCRGCFNVAAQNLTALCPNQKEAIVWLDLCMFRYSNNSILGIMSLNPAIYFVNVINASNVNLFSSELISFAGNLSNAAYNGSPRKFAGMQSNYPNAPTVYGSMECTPDLTPGDCKSCLDSIANYMSSCCYNRVGGRFFSPSCIYRFEVYPFLKELSPPSPLPLPPSESPPSASAPPPSAPALPSPPTKNKFPDLNKIHPIYTQLHDCTNTVGNYSQNSTFQSNLKTILSSVSSNINATNGFYNGKAGDGVDQVNAIAFCRGDIDNESCRDCINVAAQNLTALCPNQKEAIVWRYLCMFRYSSNSILGIKSLDPYHVLSKTTNASVVNLFSSELISFAGYLANAAYNGSPRKFKGMQSNYPSAPTVYGSMECTPDLTPGDCKSCLDNIAKDLSICCYNNIGGIWLTPSCIYRFEIYPFLNEPPPPPPLPLPPSPPPLSTSTTLLPPSPPPPTTNKGKPKTTIIVVCVIVALLVSTLIACVLITKRRRKNTSRGHGFNEEEIEEDDDFEGITQYNFALIRAATEGFSTANTLGKGGFGEVYKGVLSDGKEIAVKRLSTTSVQGEKEFRNEVKLLAKLQHNCLVRLLGFCLEQTERLLVYEFMENGSLDKVLFDAVNRSRLDWRERYIIINNVAKGLLYLHEDSRLMIIHRDLKAGNILLDEKMNAKISDFGTARLFILDENEANTRRIVGTLGYMAPEYAMHGLFSVKSDVYSYGVLLLEILSGKRNYYSLTEDSSEGLLSYAYKTWNEGKAFDLIDPMLTAGSEYSLENMMRCIHIALLCVQDNVGNRPTMASVNLMLQSLTITLPIPFEPGFFNNHTRSWLSEFLESTNSNSHSKTPKILDEEIDSYLYPR